MVSSPATSTLLSARTHHFSLPIAPGFGPGQGVPASGLILCSLCGEFLETIFEPSLGERDGRIFAGNSKRKTEPCAGNRRERPKEQRAKEGARAPVPEGFHLPHETERQTQRVSSSVKLLGQFL